MKIFQTKNLKKVSHSLFFAALFFVTFLSPKNSYADLDFGKGRIRSCDATGAVEGLNFDPTSGGKDAIFAMDNPVCLTVIATTYAATKGLIATMNGVCGTGSAFPRILPSPFLDAKDIVKATKKAISNGACASAEIAALASYTTSLVELGIIYAAAKRTYEHSKICGAQWMSADPQTYSIGTWNYKQQVQLVIDGYIRNDNSKLNLASGDKSFREWYYGGVEVEDNPDSGETCYDPTVPKVGGQYPKQKYYLKGTEQGNYNCKKYDLVGGQNDPLTGLPINSMSRIAELQQAYQCCQNRSQNYICVDFENAGQKFCRGGDRCSITSNGLVVTFSTKVVDDGRLICAETYSLCPYNFTIGGGAEYCDYYRDGIWTDGDKWSEGYWTMITQADIDGNNCSTKSEIRNADCTYNDKAGKCRNYCQYLTHCTKTAGTDFIYNSSITSPYFSTACLNFIGDSKNQTGFGGGFILGSQRHFSAPIAQCVKETLENVFYNRAGHSDCASYNEVPSADDSCPSGNYAVDGIFVHKKGNQVKAKSFFSIIQDRLQDSVKIVLTLSVMFYGMNLLTGKNDLRQKKDILVYIVKIALVLFFATGDAWQRYFFDGVYGASSEFSRMVFKIDVGVNENQRDGCQFGDLTLPDGTTILADASHRYPPGKEYLAIWDTLDCKIMRYLGFGPEVSTANIASLIFAGYFTGAIGIYFAMSVMFFGFFFIVATIRALHVFLCSATSIIIFVYISPIIIPCLLFAKTKDIFSKWLTNLISFCLQPMILFAYIAIFITVLDKSMIGSATFSGAAPLKTISCSEICKNSDGTVVPFVGDTPPECNLQGQVLINPLNDSVACLINVNDFGKFPGFEAIGLTIPILINIFESNVKERILTLFKGALVMYLLCKFMDEIPGITSNLIGGAALPAGPQIGAKALFDRARSILGTAQKRAMGASKKLGGVASRAGANIASRALDKGKSIAASQGKSKGDAVGGGGGGDSSAKGGGGDSSAKGGGGDSATSKK